MRSLALLAVGFAVFGYAAQQVIFPAPLAGHFEKLAAAPGVNVTYTFRALGESASEYKLSLAKPNLFKLTLPTGFVQSDGKTLFTYRKKTNQYIETPLTDALVADFAKRPEVFAWSDYLAKKPGDGIAQAKVGASRTVQGNDVTQVDVTLKPGGTTGALFVDKKLGIARGYTLKTADKEYLAMATAIEIVPEAKPETFAFVAPAGAQKLEAAAPTASYGEVQAIMTATCMPCHNAERQRAGVILTNYEGVVAAVTPGNGAGSRLVKSLRASGAHRMPKNRDPLAEPQIQLIEKWIDAGAKKD